MMTNDAGHDSSSIHAQPAGLRTAGAGRGTCVGRIAGDEAIYVADSVVAGTEPRQRADRTRVVVNTIFGTHRHEGERFVGLNILLADNLMQTTSRRVALAMPLSGSGQTPTTATSITSTAASSGQPVHLSKMSLGNP